MNGLIVRRVTYPPMRRLSAGLRGPHVRCRAKRSKTSPPDEAGAAPLLQPLFPHLPWLVRIGRRATLRSGHGYQLQRRELPPCFALEVTPAQDVPESEKRRPNNACAPAYPPVSFGEQTMLKVVASASIHQPSPLYLPHPTSNLQNIHHHVETVPDSTWKGPPPNFGVSNDHLFFSRRTTQHNTHSWMTPLCSEAATHGRTGWKAKPLTRADLDSNLVSMVGFGGLFL